MRDTGQIKKRPFWQKWWFLLIILFVLFRLTIPSGKVNDRIIESQPTDENVKVIFPADEAEFVRIVENAQQNNENAQNDMQRGGIKSERDKAICKTMKQLRIKNWVGKIKTIDANSDGKGVLGIALSKSISVSTWNNDFSDIGDRTLLNPDSRLFKTAANLKVGEPVKFSGSFRPSTDNECVKESSLTLHGKLRDPEFIFKFSEIQLNSGNQPEATEDSLHWVYNIGDKKPACRKSEKDLEEYLLNKENERTLYDEIGISGVVLRRGSVKEITFWSKDSATCNHSTSQYSNLAAKLSE